MRPVAAAVLACLATLALAASAGALTVRLEPDRLEVVEGSGFGLELVADLEAPVLGFGLDLAFDPAVLASAAPPVLGPAWLPVAASDGDGLAGVAFPAGIQGAGVLLATLRLAALAPGETDLVLSVTEGDLTEGFPLDPEGFAAVTFLPARVTVRPIPEPASLVLLVAGLAGLKGLRASR